MSDFKSLPLFTNLSNQSQTPFEAIRHIDERGKEYWLARELMPIMQYTDWRNFKKVIAKAKKNRKALGNNSADHIVALNSMIEVGKGAQREVEDFKLSRLMCYLIAMNGDPAKSVIAEAQTYFAIQTRKQELFELGQIEPKSKEYHQLRNNGFTDIEAAQVIRERDKLSEVFKDVAGTWQRHGAKGGDYAILRNIWSEVLTGKTATQIKREMGLSEAPWNYDSALDLVVNQIYAIIARGYHDNRQSDGRDELARDLQDAGPTVAGLRDTLAEQYSAKPRPLPIKGGKQVKLLKGAE